MHGPMNVKSTEISQNNRFLIRDLNPAPSTMKQGCCDVSIGKVNIYRMILHESRACNKPGS